MFNRKKETLDDVRAKTLEHAQHQLEEHVQALEHHQAMISKYENRIARLSKPQPERA